MIWIVVALAIIVLFVLFGYTRRVIKPNYSVSENFRRKLKHILEQPINVSLELLKKELDTSSLVEKLYIYYHIARIYYEKGSYGKSMRLLRSLLVSPYIPYMKELHRDIVILLGRIYLRTRRYKEGIEFLKEHRIDTKDYFMILSKLYEGLGDYLQALNYYRKALSSGDRESLANYLAKLSIESARKGNLTSARSLLLDASKLAQTPMVLSAQGIIAFYEGKFEEAGETLKLALDKDASIYVYIREELRDAFYEADKLDEFMDVLRSSPNPIANLDYIRTLYNMGMVDNARNYMKERKEVFFNSLGLLARLHKLFDDKEITDRMVELALETPIYVCKFCEYESDTYLVECPNCFRIASFTFR